MAKMAAVVTTANRVRTANPMNQLDRNLRYVNVMEHRWT
jgi:hypothetical protein